MGTNGLMTAVTLYQSGTLTLPQAAKRTGVTPESFAQAVKRYDIFEKNQLVSAE